ncbi:hypothetical protein AB8S91_30815, partial [Klebsiella pneumoniae]
SRSRLRVKRTKPGLLQTLHILYLSVMLLFAKTWVQAKSRVRLLYAVLTEQALSKLLSLSHHS